VTAAQHDGESTGDPTVLRMLLGSHLRRLRESRGVSREDAGWEIRSSESKISRMELGRVGFKERDVADLLSLYGLADGEERGRLLTLARDANTPGWWQRYGGVFPNWFQSYLGLEAAAELIRTYEVQFVPGLLQTRDYARAVVLLGHEKAAYEEIERRVDLRMARQRALSRPDAPQVWYLVEVTEVTNVRLQVIPFHVGGHAAAGGAFSILRFPDQDLPDVVYIEQLTSAMYLDKREDVEHYVKAMERLCVEAEPPDHTAEVLHAMLRNLP
jgi:hypothetical protein